MPITNHCLKKDGDKPFPNVECVMAPLFLFLHLESLVDMIVNHINLEIEHMGCVHIGVDKVHISWIIYICFHMCADHRSKAILIPIVYKLLQEIFGEN